jgi:hypothetical protein
MAQRRISEPLTQDSHGYAAVGSLLCGCLDPSMVKWSVEENWVSELNPKYSLVIKALRIQLSDFLIMS